MNKPEILLRQSAQKQTGQSVMVEKGVKPCTQEFLYGKRGRVTIMACRNTIGNFIPPMAIFGDTVVQNLQIFVSSQLVRSSPWLILGG
jgi:hypothetical protein